MRLTRSGSDYWWNTKLWRQSVRTDFWWFWGIDFSQSSFGKRYLGKPDLLRSFKSEHALNFTSRFYKATNMIFFIQGNIDFKKVIRTIESDSRHSFSITERQRTEPFLYIPKDIEHWIKTHQAHVMVAGYNAYNEKRTGLYLLDNLLGGPGMNSRLNVSLRERRGLVYNVKPIWLHTQTQECSLFRNWSGRCRPLHRTSS